jgi:hypothetical protein
MAQGAKTPMDNTDRTRSDEAMTSPEGSKEDAAMLSDETWQLGVLTSVVVMHPERLSYAELRREMLVDEQEFSQTDDFDRAVRGLVASGLLRHDGDSVIPTRAAMRFAALNGCG